MSKRKFSLDAAIRVAKVKVDIDDEYITVQKSDPLHGVASTKIGPYATSHVHDKDTNLNYQAKFWKGKCEALTDERAVLEEQLVEKLSSVVKKYDDLRTYAQLLEEKCSRAPSANELDKTSIALETAAKKITLYESMTSMAVDINDDNVYTCTVKNPVARKATRFKVRMVKTAEGDMAVEPRANINLLPEYLQQGEIIFESSTAPILMSDVISSLFGKATSSESDSYGESP